MTDDQAPPQITPLENASLEVTGIEDLRNSRGEKIETKKKFYLCRCGHSGNKPFCDSTHKKVNFSSENPRHHIPDRQESYPAGEITILDNRGICSHSENCTKNLPQVFNKEQKPWIHPDTASADEIRKVIRMCPSGALSWEEQGRPTPDSIDFYSDLERPQIVTDKNGPYLVRGRVEISGLKTDNGASRDHFTLCRCGASKYKPRCDGAHWDEDFIAD